MEYQFVLLQGIFSCIHILLPPLPPNEPYISQNILYMVIVIISAVMVESHELVNP